MWGSFFLGEWLSCKNKNIISMPWSEFCFSLCHLDAGGPEVGRSLAWREVGGGGAAAGTRGRGAGAAPRRGARAGPDRADSRTWVQIFLVKSSNIFTAATWRGGCGTCWPGARRRAAPCRGRRSPRTAAAAGRGSPAAARPCGPGAASPAGPGTGTAGCCRDSAIGSVKITAQEILLRGQNHD